MIETEMPRFLSKRPNEATLIPFPTDEATPPVTKIYFDIRPPLPGALQMYLGAHKGQYISKEETISHCHPERSEGSVSSERSFAALRMTMLKRLRLTRNTSYLKCLAHKGPLLASSTTPAPYARCDKITTCVSVGKLLRVTM